MKALPQRRKKPVRQEKKEKTPSTKTKMIVLVFLWMMIKIVNCTIGQVTGCMF